MNEPVDLWQATADGMYEVLAAAITDPATPVRQELPENPAGSGYILIADMDAEPSGGKFEVVDTITVDVLFVYRGDLGRRGLRALMWTARNALENARLAVDGVAFSPTAWVGGNTASDKDGVTFVGVQQFEVTAEPA